MLTRQIAEKIQLKVASLVNQPLSVVDPNGAVLSSNNPNVDESIDLSEATWAIKFRYSGKIAGYVILAYELPNHQEISPLICSIAELVMHQSILIETIPHQEERLDKFIYDLLNPEEDGTLIEAEARLFEIDLERPRIALVISIDDPILKSNQRIPSSDREIRISRYRSGITRALNSYYTSSRDNIVAYLGEDTFCVLKDLANGGQLESNLESFKKSINTVYDILKSETKAPTAVGIGNYHPGTGGLQQSYHEAVNALELGRQMWDGDKVYHIDDFGVVAPLLSGVDEQNIYFSRDLLEKIGQNEEIIQTLEAFFNLDMSLTKTADTLGIHRNTLVYRLDRIKDTLGLDPRNFEDAVQIKLAILFNKFIESEYAY
jgi:carbohydrate diacid regulator